jgi:hypothetical protein
MTQLGSVFGINKGIVHRICSKEMADFEAHLGHPCLLSADQEEHVIEYIGTSFASHCPVSPKQIRAHVQKRYNIVASHGWLWHVVRRHADQLDPAKAYPQEDVRMNATK